MIKSIIFFAIITSSCSNFINSDKKNKDLELLKIDKINKLETENSIDMKGLIVTFLTFQKADAEQAMNFYVELFENSKVDNINRWGKEGSGQEGTIMHATFTLNGKPFMCSDSPAIHGWGFTPAISNYIDCEDESEIERLFSKLSENGKIMMPLNNYGFSQKFGFVEDRFGISWQLNLQ